MLKKIAILAIITCAAYCNKTIASHIVGGEVYYTRLGKGTLTNTSIYKVSLRLFRDCNIVCGSEVACLPKNPLISVYTNSVPYIIQAAIELKVESVKSLSLKHFPACISMRPSVCYEVNNYEGEITLDDNEAGYVLAYQNCCRAASANVLSNANTANNVPGVTYTCIMSGRQQLPAGYNSSAVFNINDTSLVCYQSDFSLDFGAVDPDGDSLSYEFDGAYDGGFFTQSQDTQPADKPEYNNVSYNEELGFGGKVPLGPKVFINPVTGIISGIAPNPGNYVVNVVVKEWRNSVIISSHRKDFNMLVSNCNIPQAVLKPIYTVCDGNSLRFENESTSPLITSYYWSFSLAGNIIGSSNAPVASYTFPDTGTYSITLYTNKGQSCSDSANAIAKIYPGIKADFKVIGSCYQSPFLFSDVSVSPVGQIESRRWDFGDKTVATDTSTLQNASYTYPDMAERKASLIVTSSVGCADTVYKTINVTDKATISFAFTDTLICNIDTLRLMANTAADVSWMPNTPDILLYPLSRTPLVFPKTTTYFIVTSTEKNCVGVDTIRVNVTDKVFVDAGPDTAICLSDTLQFHPQSDALYFSWSPPASFINPLIKEALAVPVAKTIYHVTASIGKCNSEDEILVSPYPYPEVNAMADVTICNGTNIQLKADVHADNFIWSPASSLDNANILMPIAKPLVTTNYVLTAYNSTGCLIPVKDTVAIRVLPPVKAYAGRDTTIVANQPLQLNASGGDNYVWTPSYGLSNPQTADPIATLNSMYDTITYKVKVSISPEGCFAEDDIKIFIFKTLPDIFIPSGFTPNADGRNDLLKPIAAGIQKLNFFSVFNRWGQLVFSTRKLGEGWDGYTAGKLQPNGTYIYITQALDYKGALINRKGTVVLIR